MIKCLGAGANVSLRIVPRENGIAAIRIEGFGFGDSVGELYSLDQRRQIGGSER